MSAVVQPNRDLIRQARLAQALTACWMVVELVVALAAGIAAHSVALTAFGVDSGIEIFTSLVVLRQLLLHTDHATDEELDRRERQASRLVGGALYGLVVYIVVSSAASLIARSRPQASTVGIAFAVVVLIVMPVLWRWRLGLARRLPSPALHGDAACSLVCIYMAATLLAGLVVNDLFGWWWADPLAGLAMIWWIRGEAREALEAARTGQRDADGRPGSVPVRASELLGDSLEAGHDDDPLEDRHASRSGGLPAETGAPWGPLLRWAAWVGAGAGAGPCPETPRRASEE